MPDPQRNLLLDAALQYAGYGWRVLPLRAKSKIPRFPEWPALASSNQIQVEAWWNKWPNANVGIVFGEATGLCEIEGDHPESDKSLVELFDGDVPVTCCFAGARGKHWLFRWRPDLPGGASIKIGHLEIRTGNGEKGAQSVFPPSIHPTGKMYTWLVPPEVADVATLPDTVAAKLWNLSGEVSLSAPVANKQPAEHWEKILAGLPEGERASGMVSYVGKILRNATDLDDETNLQVIYRSVVAVNDKCKPPRDEAELRKEFDSILGAERRRRRAAKEVGNAVGGNQSAPIDRSQKFQPVDWRLVIMESDPPIYELYAPQFKLAENGCLLLTAEQCCNGGAIRVQALKQAHHPLTRSFATNWDKRQQDSEGNWYPSLFERLVLAAEHRKASAEEKRYVTIAERLLVQLAKAREIENGSDVDIRGRPCRLEDGSVVFGFTHVWEEMKFGPDKIERPELSQLLKRLGKATHWNGSTRFMKLSPTALEHLKTLLRDSPEE